MSSAHYTESYGVNRLNYNSAAGVFFSSGETKELYVFLSSMKPSHINTFLGGTVTIQQLDVPLNERNSQLSFFAAYTHLSRKGVVFIKDIFVGLATSALKK